MIAEIFRRERFADAEATEAFAAHSNERKFKARQVFLFAGAATYAAYAILDYLVTGEKAFDFITLRLFLVTPIMLIVAFAFKAGLCRGHENLAFVIFSTPVMASIVYMCLSLEGPIADLYPIGMVVPAFFMTMLMLPTFRFTALLVSQVLAGLLVVTLYSDISMEGIYANHYFLWMSCIVLLFGMFFLENIERSQYIYKLELEKSIATLRESEQRAMRLYHEAKHAEQAKSEFLAVVSHELRTPMNAIIGFSEIISKEMLGIVRPAQYQEYAVHINDSGQQLLTIINDILDISRAEMGKISFEDRIFDLAATVSSAITACSANAQNANVTVLRAENQLKELEIEGDEARLLQAMTNIIGNAIKFSNNEGTVIVDLSFTPLGEVCFRVTDRGIGISEEDIEQIRQPFQQAESAFARNNGGLGLGLAICNIVANAHHGALEIESTLGEGTRVSIIMPPTCVMSTAKPQTAA